MKIAVVTDSNAGLTDEGGKALGVYVMPMPLFVDDVLYYEGRTLSQEGFYEKLKTCKDVHTSQPSPADVMDLWDELLKEYDQIIHIPMSSGLSSTCETATMLANDEPYEGKVFVVDAQRIAPSQKQTAIDALNLANAGFDGATIKKILTETKFDSSIYIMVDTMEYLKKGGRVTPAAAGIATILNIKPVLQIQGGKLDQYSKCRGIKSAKKDIIKAIKNDVEGRFSEFYKAGKMKFFLAYSGTDLTECKAFAEEVKAAFPEIDYELEMDPLSLSVSCHIGPGAIAMVCCRVLGADDVK